MPDIRRIKKTQHWFSRYVLQHLYVPVLYTLLSIKTRLQDLVIVYVLRKDGAIRLNEFSKEETAVLVGSKVG